LIFLFLVFLTGSLFANEGTRPMREIAPDPSLPLYSFNSLLPVLQAENSLITSYALEQPLTKHYITQYSSPHGIATLNAILERGNIYLPFIREEVKRLQLPPELAYLPIIESGFLITARSRSGAVGLWQFMMNSISPYNMRVTDLIDERRDFVKSTTGALLKLQDNYKTLGSWELALAAYNSGLGAISRTIQRTGRRDYWELVRRNDLRQETTHFVPKLIAAVYVISQPRKYGINIWHERFEWTAIPLPRQVSIDMLADETGISRDLLRSLNAELLHGISPADNSYRLKIPTSHIEQITQILEQDDKKLIRYHYHVVRLGDTLWSMSRHYNTPVNMIEQHNPGISNRYLRIGETVIIPAFGNVPAGMPAAAVSAAGANINGSHVVQKGETFWSLGRRYGIDPQSLAEANGMRLNDILHEGRTLKVPILE